MKRGHVVALRAFPDLHRFFLSRLVFGRWLEEIAERRIPLLLSLEKGISWQATYQLLEAYPVLTCVLCDIGIWGVDRYTWPLLENYPNVYVETSLLALEDGGMEATVARYGAERLLFGSGFPERYPESAILQLLHADISESDRQKIASGNLKRVLAQVRI
jgi:predicted TIM-barrel fold metal-dependent hydrolase